MENVVNFANEEDVSNMDVTQEDKQESPLQAKYVLSSCLNVDPNQYNPTLIIQQNGNSAKIVDPAIVDVGIVKDKDNLKSQSGQCTNTGEPLDSIPKDLTNSNSDLVLEKKKIQTGVINKIKPSNNNVEDTACMSFQDCYNEQTRPDVDANALLVTNNNNNNNVQSTVLVKDLVISDGFLDPNTVKNRPTLQPIKPLNKTFAQIVAPPTVTASIPNKGSTPECGLLVERTKGTTLDDYARALEVVTGKKTLVFIGQSPDNPHFVMAFLEQPNMVEKVASVGIIVRGRWLCVTHLRQPATKLIVSEVLPYVPDNVILNACRSFGEPVFEHLRRIPSSVRAQEYKHLLSFRRELLIVIDKEKSIPDHVLVFSHNVMHKFGIAAPGLVCFNCKMHGHRAFNCRNPKAIPVEGYSSSNNETQVLSIEQTSSQHMKDQRPIRENVNQPNLTQPSRMQHNATPAKPTEVENLSNQGHKDPDHSRTQSFSINNVIESTTIVPPTSAYEKGTWFIAGKKKGKIMPLNKESASTKQVAKTIKIGKDSDVAASKQNVSFLKRQENPPSSPDRSSTETDVKTQNSKSSKVKKRKKGKTKSVAKDVDLSNKINNDYVEGSPPTFPQLQQQQQQQEKQQQEQQKQEQQQEQHQQQQQQKQQHDAERGAIQLRRIMDKVLQSQPAKGQKSKLYSKEILTAQPIVEELLNSVWSLRSSRRRAALTDFQAKHSQIIKYLEVIMASIPFDMHTTQVYRTLVGIRHEVKSTQSTDSRKSRKSSI